MHFSYMEKVSLDGHTQNIPRRGLLVRLCLPRRTHPRWRQGKDAVCPAPPQVGRRGWEGQEVDFAPSLLLCLQV